MSGRPGRTDRKKRPRPSLGRAAGPLSHLAWGAAVAGQIIGAATFDLDGDDFGPGMIIEAVTGLLAGLVTTIVVVADTPPATRSGRPGRRRHRTGRPWDSPAVFGYLTVWVVVAAILSLEGLAVGAVILVISGLLGTCLYLLGLLEMVCVLGLLGFGSILLGRADQDEEGSRLLALGPFVSTVGVSLWFLPVIGCFGYDSPYRRDILPLVGGVRDGVEVTHPSLLLVGQIGTALVLGLIAAGAAVHAVVTRRHT